MTKSLKALSAHTFSARTELDQIFSDRQAAALVSPFLSQPIDSLGAAAGAASVTVSIADSIDSDVRTAATGGDFLVLPCLTGKAMTLNFMETGHSPTLNGEALSFGVPPTISDEVGLTVIVGGSVSANIDVDGDTDDITVFLISGQVYMISMQGSGASAINDSFLRVYNPAMTLIGQDDDGGNDLYSIFSFTAAATGNFTIRAGTFANPGDPDVGGYTVDVRVMGVDSVGATNPTSVTLAQGQIFGWTETNGDVDRYKVHLEAGKFYEFKVAGGADYNTDYLAVPVGELDTRLTLRNVGGSIIASADDIVTDRPPNFSDISSKLGFFATTTGDFYLDVNPWSPGNKAGYELEFHEIPLDSLNPLDAIDWESAENVPFVDVAGVPTAYVYFAAAGDTFGEPGVSYGWNAFEQQQFMQALEEYEHILGTNYEITTDVNQATFRVFTTTSTQFGAYFYPQDPAFDTQQGIGAFNVDSGGWNKPGASVPAYPIGQESLDRGGYSFAVILHELGHAHGQAHPHDNGGGSDVMPGVTASTGSYGVFNLNQGVYTVMSYNDSWDFHPDGPSPFTLADIDHGWSASLGAFDIAELQVRYGVHAYNTGDNVYTLIDIAEDAFYECIWDSGGTDAIAYGGALNAIIDLTAATIDYTPTGGGVISYLDNGPAVTTLRGGFTIAQGVVIENATGGTGNDTLVGNSAANVLTANDGADNLVGRGGDDTLHGGAGADTAYYDGNRADYTVTAIITAGVITGFTVKDDNIAAPADSSNPVTVANEGTDTLDGVESLDFADVTFSLAGTVAVFDGGGNLVSMHTTIQAAIDAATTLDGYTIFASAGTYAEDVNVTKDLTIEGANEGVTGDDGGRIAETSIRSLAISANGVTVDGVEVTGTVTYGSYLAGIYVSGDDFSLVNSVLDGPDTGPPNTSPVAILTELVSDLDVGGNLITGYSQGIYVSGGATTGSVHDNIFQGDGSGSGSGTQNGLLSESTLLLIENNTFDGIDGGSFYALPQGPGDTLDLLDIFIGNIITDSGADRPIQIYPSTLTPNVLGTDEAEAFVGDWGGLAGVDLTFDGRGGSDHIYGDSGDDTFTGGADNDLMVGGAGTDTAVLDGAEVAYVDTAIGWAVSSSDGNDFLQQMEIVEADGQRNLLVGSTGYASLQVALNAAVADDNIRLATGNYNGTYTYDETGLSVIAQPGAALNATFSTAGTDGISVYGGNNVDTITTDDGDDTLSGGGGNDVLNGMAGADAMSGGTGNDTFYVDNGGDQVNEVGGAGNDRIITSVSYTLGGDTSVETLEAVAGVSAINLTGNYLVQTLIGNDGANQLHGGGGGDTLIGLGGNDIYFTDYATTQVVETAGGGNDQLYSSVSFVLGAGSEVEFLSTNDASATGAINLTGNGFNQTMVGNDGANQLHGGGGVDVLVGLGGNDIYYTDVAATQAIEGTGGGSDQLYTSVSYVLAAGSEIELLSTNDASSTAAIDLTGNQFGQLLLGNDGANVLDGKDGNDNLVGYGGADTFAFTTALGAGNVDNILDFAVGTDKIALDDAVFTGLTPGALAAGAFVNGTTAGDADDRILYNSATGQIYFDADGNGGGAAVLFATVTAGTILTASDFTVI
jgi:Ca2+-binding RTX toxin-like protein